MIMRRTNIELDEKLVKEAMSISSFRSKKELVNAALRELVRRLKRKGILDFMGSGCWEGNLDKSRRGRA